MVKEITIYESFDGTRFDSLNEANNYEDRLKNQAIRALCNHDYDGWEDYICLLGQRKPTKKEIQLLHRRTVVRRKKDKI